MARLLRSVEIPDACVDELAWSDEILVRTMVLIGMEFIEGGKRWEQLPDWASFMVDVGYGWPLFGAPGRRIALVSTPVDSTAAGLVALGALRRQLEDPRASDVEKHFERILELSRRKGGVVLTSIGKGYKGKFLLEGSSSDEIHWATKCSGSGERITVLRGQAAAWQIDGEPKIEVGGPSLMPNSVLYENLMPTGGDIFVQNLRRSDSSICLAGRVGGELPAKSHFARVLLRPGPSLEALDLAQILTINEWSNSPTSRMLYFNSRTGNIDRATRSPMLVVADGIDAFLRALDFEFFQRSDVVGVVCRETSGDKLDMLKSKMFSLLQWFQPTSWPQMSNTKKPRGVSLSSLRTKDEVVE